MCHFLYVGLPPKSQFFAGFSSNICTESAGGQSLPVGGRLSTCVPSSGVHIGLWPYVSRRWLCEQFSQHYHFAAITETDGWWVPNHTSGSDARPTGNGSSTCHCKYLDLFYNYPELFYTQIFSISTQTFSISTQTFSIPRPFHKYPHFPYKMDLSCIYCHNYWQCSQKFVYNIRHIDQHFLFKILQNGGKILLWFDLWNLT